MAKIPNIFHFCYFGGRPFSLVNFLAIKSAHDVNQPEKINIYLDVEPTGEWWKRSKEFLEIIKIKVPSEVFGVQILDPAHKADVVRLSKLIESGGIYLDLDVICSKSFEPFLNNSLVLGQEIMYGKLVGLCNAVILSEKDSSFAKRWLDGFDPQKSLWKGYRSKGVDMYYSEMSVKYSNFLSMIYPEEIHIEPAHSFFYPNYSPEELAHFFLDDTNDFDTSYCHHLWTNSTHDSYLKDLTVEKIKNQTTTFSKLALRFL